MKKCILTLMLFPVVLFAVEGDPLSFLDSIMEAIKGLGAGQTMALVAMVMEFIFRMIKTPVPLSIAWLIAKGLKKVGELCAMLAALLDKVLPQRVQEV